ncbi:hypothetical protein PP175_15265 [Aneurinibacillus sp. Ricciae_BoGa-3]|uniref:hypothetical protein n=1 Tax=Aneurinibacillus sp. Ricciae_BoGa-3 TaxID=3022697 RepID=UPI0023425C10|nr:hypothetical protein [Aneurinibacillus sp. Ricciae_BoGa-3]WCK52783.1 hypothetical protein PP175_15265 [Aneurinibacillus sp. Ricciae_BoGa-3]
MDHSQRRKKGVEGSEKNIAGHAALSFPHVEAFTAALWNEVPFKKLLNALQYVKAKYTFLYDKKAGSWSLPWKQQLPAFIS